MSSSKLTLLGMYQWLNSENIDMFDSFKNLPSDIDVDTLTGVILREGGEFEPIYANPYMMRDQIQIFVLSHLRTFNKWVDALNIEYNPLENYDRIEDWSDTGESHKVDASTHSDDSTHNDSVDKTGSHNTSRNDNSNGNTSHNSEQSASSSGRTDGGEDSTVTNNVSAFDSSTMSPHDESITSSTIGNMTSSSGTTKTEESGTSSSHSSGYENGSDTERETATGRTSNSGRVNASEDGTSNSTHSGRTHGNIGVTTSQQMLQSELDIARFNLYEQICDLFVDELLLAVYI